jgi:hypothetical protein
VSEIFFADFLNFQLYEHPGTTVKATTTCSSNGGSSMQYLHLRFGEYGVAAALFVGEWLLS